jgi:hypothetical protein
MSDTGDLFSLLGEPSSPPRDDSAKPEKTREKKATKRDSPSPAPPEESRSLPSIPANAVALNEAFPALETTEAVRTRCIETLSAVDAALVEFVPAELPFPIEDDPFTKTAEEWEAVWYAARESAYRVYLNMRMEFRRQLSRALAGEPSDIKPWTYWVMNGAPPAEGEPVHGLTGERRSALGWPYPGPAEDFEIYRAPAQPEGL